MTNSKSGWAFWLVWSAAVVFLVASTMGMPDMVGAKFSLRGELAGWLPKWAYAASEGFAMLVLPLLVAELPAFLVRKQSRWARVPHAHFWMRPENRDHAAKMLKSQLQEVGVLMMVYQCFRHWLVVEAHSGANRTVDVTAAMASVMALVVCVGLWVLMRYWMWTPVDKTAEGQ